MWLPKNFFDCLLLYDDVSQIEKPACPVCKSNSSVNHKGDSPSGQFHYRCHKCKKNFSSKFRVISVNGGKEKALGGRGKFMLVPEEHVAVYQRDENIKKLIKYFENAEDFTQKVILYELGFTKSTYLRVLKILSTYPNTIFTNKKDAVFFNLSLKLKSKNVTSFVNVRVTEFIHPYKFAVVEEAKFDANLKGSSELENFLTTYGLKRRIEKSSSKKMALSNLASYTYLYNFRRITQPKKKK